MASILFLWTPLAGKKRDPDAAMAFIREMYKHQAQSPDKKENKTIYPHFTCATDTNNIRKVFDDVKDTVLIKSLQEYGVLWPGHVMTASEDGG